MQLGMVGLGRMGANMARRLKRGGHDVIGFDLDAAKGDVIVAMDGDLQHEPEEIPKLIDAIQSQDLDLVYGFYDSKKHHAFRNLGSALINGFYRKVFNSSVTLSSFRIIRIRGTA